MAIYPNSIFPWTQRQNNIDVVWAADPNELAAEIQAIESIIGTNPNIETHPPTGNNVTYGSLSSRVSDAENNALLPYAVLTNPGGFFIGAGNQKFNSYVSANDPYSIWNGSDGTIPCNGWWTISAEQKWNQLGNNFYGGNVQFLVLNGNIIESDVWVWDAQFGITGPAHFGVAVGVSGMNESGFSAPVIGANGFTHVFWQGQLKKGDRLQSLSINNTFCPGIQVTNISMKLFCNRTIAGSFTSG
jgi:hypothetical protein